jgi:hypothetical protein
MTRGVLYGPRPVKSVTGLEHTPGIARSHPKFIDHS